MLSLQVRGVNFLKVLLVGGVFSVATVFAQSGEKLDPALIKKGAGILNPAPLSSNAMAAACSVFIFPCM